VRKWGIRNMYGDPYEETLDEDDPQTAKPAGAGKNVIVIESDSSDHEDKRKEPAS
jgi:hypothetical protein